MPRPARLTLWASLLATAAILALAGASFLRPLSLGQETQTRADFVGLRRGRLALSHIPRHLTHLAPGASVSYDVVTSEVNAYVLRPSTTRLDINGETYTHVMWLGLAYTRNLDASHDLSFPLPYLGLPTALAAYIAHGRTRRSLPYSQLCPTCHYDLRATPAQCPECGRRDFSRG